MKQFITNADIEYFLDNFEKESETIILEESKEKKELEKIAKAKGMSIKNSRDLSMFKTIYAFTDKPNANGAILPQEELLKALPQIVGKPISLNHNRTIVIGHYVDYIYRQKKNMIIAYGVFYKSNFGDLWKEAKKLFKAKKLSSSFEIWSPKEKRKYQEDGTYELHQMEIAGGALVYEKDGVEPAFKDAKVLQIAKQKTSELSEELVYASKYKCSDILINGKLECSNCGRCKKEIKKAEVVTVENKEEKTHETEIPKPQSTKTKCSNCQADIEYNGIDIRLKCPKCFAILNKEGVMQYPPQIKDFKLVCPSSSCGVQNWLIVKNSDNGAIIQCQSCSKEYSITFALDKTKEVLNKVNFIYTSRINCHQCNNSIYVAGMSNMTTREVKCKKCGLQFSYDIYNKRYRQIAEIKQIDLENKEDKLAKSSKKGGTQNMFTLSISKYHRIVDDYDKMVSTLPSDYSEKKEGENLIVSKKLSSEERKALPDSKFAVVVRVKNKKTGKIHKVRMFPIHDEAHVRNSLARLPQAKETLQRLGVTIDSVKVKILSRAKQLKIKDLLKPYEKSTVEPKKVEEKVKTKDVKVKVEIKKENPLEAKVKELEKKNSSLGKELEDATKKIEFYKINAKEIVSRREELDSFGEDLSDEDILNDDKFVKAQVLKENAELRIKTEKDTEAVGDKILTGSSEYYAKKRKKIDEVAFGHLNKKKK